MSGAAASVGGGGMDLDRRRVEEEEYDRRIRAVESVGAANNRNARRTEFISTEKEVNEELGEISKLPKG